MTIRKSMPGVVILLLIVVVALAASPARAQDQYPNRPIKIIVPRAAGSAVDLGVRFFADKWAEFLGQPVVVVNKPGAGGALASRFVAHEKPDGYTLLSISDSSIIGSRLERKDAGYDLDSFAFIVMFSEIPFFYTVKSDTKWQTLPDFVRDARNAPGKLKYGALGVNNALAMATNMLSRSGGIQLTLVPFASSADILASLVQGNVNLAVTWGLPGIGKSPMVRPLAVSTEERVADQPAVPTLRELGYPVRYTSSPNALVAPGKTPDRVLQKIVDAHNKVRQKYAGEMRDRLPNLGQYPAYSEREALVKLYREKERMFKEFYQEIGFKPE